jgi:hypothetical protein
MTVQIVTTEAGSAAMPNPSSCYWCDRPFRPRQTGGRAQRFCKMSCRRAFHAAARRWALDAIGAGMLTIDHIRKGVPTKVYVAGDGIGAAELTKPGETGSALAGQEP